MKLHQYPHAMLMTLLLLVPSAAHSTDWQPESVSTGLAYTVDANMGLRLESGWQVFGSDAWRLRAGLEKYNDKEQHTVSLVKFTENANRLAVDINLDRYIFPDQGWYVSAGLMHMNKASGWKASPEPDTAYIMNGRQYASAHLEEPEVEMHYQSLIPRLGIGWTYPRNKTNRNWQLDFGLGLLLNLDPKFEVKTSNPFDLPFLSTDLQYEADRYIERVKQENQFFDEQALHAHLSFSYFFN